MKFWSYSSKHWNSYPILPFNGILALFLEALELCPYSSKHWFSGPIIIHIGILTPSFETLECWPYSYKHCNSSLVLPLQTLEFFPYLYPFNQWNLISGIVRPNIWILAVSLYTLEFWPPASFLILGLRPYFYNHRNSGPILTNTGIRISSFHWKLWNSGTILLNIGVLVLFSKTLQFLFYPSKHWNSCPIFIHIGFFFYLIP